MIGVPRMPAGPSKERQQAEKPCGIYRTTQVNKRKRELWSEINLDRIPKAVPNGNEMASFTDQWNRHWGT